MYPYRISTNINEINRSPQFNIATEPHYKIRKYLEEDSLNIPNKKILKKIISTAVNQKKFQGSIDLNVPGNKNVLTDSDSEQNINMKKINKNMLKQNGCANLIIKKIESKAPQRNEEYYKFTNQKRIYSNNDPFYGTRTLTNWNNRLIKQASPLYIPKEQNNFYNYNYNNNYKAYNVNNNKNKVIPTPDTHKTKNIIKNDNNFQFNSTVDLRQINFNNNINNKIKNKKIEISRSPNQQISYESSADAEQGSSSYVYYPANKRIKKNIYKENEFSVQSISNNEEPYIKKNLEIKIKKINNKPKIPIKRPSITELINLNKNNNGFSILQNKFNQKLIKNVIKIQSVWRSYSTREAITKNLNIIRFVIVLYENIKNKYFDYISEIFYELKNMKIKSEKNENYNDLLKDYNLLLNEYEKIEKEMNQIKAIQKNNYFDNLNIVNKENNFEILDINLNSSRDIQEKENEKENENINNKKIFDIIEPEQKEEFSIMKIDNDTKKLKAKHKLINIDNKKIFDIIEPEQKEEFSIIKTDNDTKKLRAKHNLIKNEKENENKSEEKINNLLSNISIVKTTQFKIEENNIQNITLVSKENLLISKNDNFSFIEEVKKMDKKEELIEENQKNMNIAISENNPISSEIKENTKEIIDNDKNEKPIIDQKDSDKKILYKFHYKFKDDELIIVKKVNFNINKGIKLKNYSIDNNTLYIKKSKKKEKPKEKEKENIIKDKNDFNKINEIEKLNSIEINTLEMKKNIIKQDDESMEQITNKNEIIKSEKQFSEKAKKNMIKMILPIRLKATLKDFIRKKVIKLLKNYKE